MAKPSGSERDGTNATGAERRTYVRMDSVFPVQFQCVGEADSPKGPWVQAFTSNVSSGGILVDLHAPEQAVLSSLTQGARVLLKMQIPVGVPASGSAIVEWISEDHAGARFLIGLSYESMDSRVRSRITRYARARQFFFYFVLGVIFLLCMSIAAVSYRGILLMKGNEALTEELIRILQDSSVAKQKIKDISREKETLQLKIDALQSRITALGEEQWKTQEAEAQSKQKLGQMSAAVEKLEREKNTLHVELMALQRKENAVSEELLKLGEKKSMLQKANIEAMYRWLTVHQNGRTGLLASFEGDEALARIGFSYDQALAIQAFCVFSDFERARKAIEFFAKKAKRDNKLFYTSYYVNDGSPAEFTVRAGPNLWLGISSLQFARLTGERDFIKFAEEIADAILSLRDEEGGIRGGPDVEWYSTEHNLDGYAFFSMLHELTGDARYAQTAETLLRWLSAHAYDAADIPVNRGKGDATIATDTYAWSIAAVGPEKLSACGMNPEKIMEFADEKCFVETGFTRPDGTNVRVAGYDFAPAVHIGRGGVVSSEWSAQMIVSLRIMADYWRGLSLEAKARTYEDKAEERLISLCNMIISSPSPSGQGESCMPYASQENVDTGHGWRTPAGLGTGSVAGTSYTIFAFHRHNPLRLISSAAVGTQEKKSR